MSEKLYIYRRDPIAKYKVWWSDDAGYLMSDVTTPKSRYWILKECFDRDYTEIKNKVKKHFCVYTSKNSLPMTSQLYDSGEAMIKKIGPYYTILCSYVIEIDED
jgi:hypothetical protein